ncbi:MAG TPA: hypothetical protein VED02_04485 [Methyloceanibacter sp.]|nr:hypothetical protein [Methyloceanibacter sp.]
MSEGALIMGRDLRSPGIQTTYGSYFESIEELPAITIFKEADPSLSRRSIYKQRNAPDRPGLLGLLALGRH